MQPDVVIKEFEAGDATLLSAVAIQAYSEHYADTWYDGGAWYMDTFLSPARLQLELQDSKARFFLIYDNAVAVGFLKLNLDKPLDGKNAALELERIYLLKQISGKGIGTAVLQFVFDLARKLNYPCIWLKVMDTNPDAVRFYERAGFVVCGTHAVDFAQKKEGMRGMYVMQKYL